MQKPEDLFAPPTDQELEERRVEADRRKAATERELMERQRQLELAREKLYSYRFNQPLRVFYMHGEFGSGITPDGIPEVNYEVKIKELSSLKEVEEFEKELGSAESLLHGRNSKMLFPHDADLWKIAMSGLVEQLMEQEGLKHVSQESN